MNMPGETLGIFGKVRAYGGNIEEYAWGHVRIIWES